MKIVYSHLIFGEGEPSMDPSATNGSETFHRDFNRQFYICHPYCFVMINILLEVQEESYLKIGTIKRNVQNKKNKKTWIILHMY